MAVTHSHALFSIAGLAILTVVLVDDAPQNAAPRLADARAVVDAAAFASLQEAFDALPAEGGAVRLPPGRFEIERPLRVHRDDVLIEGAGTSTWIVNTVEDGSPALVIEPPEDAASDAYLWRVTLRGFRLTGNEKSGHGILARRVNEIFIDGITVSRHGGDGVRLDHCYEDPRVSDSLITYNAGTGLHLLACHDIVVSANQFEENRDALRCIDGFNLCMSGNNLDDHLGDGVVIENTYGSVVAANMIEECRGRAIVLDRDCYGIALSANVIAHNAGGGIDLRDAWGSAISANAFTISGGDALRVGSGSGRIAVTGNAFSDSSIGDAKKKRAEDDRAAGGVVLEGATDVNLSGNIFSGLRPAGVRLEGVPSRRLLVTGNLLVDAERATTEASDSIVEKNLEAQGDEGDGGDD